MSNKKAEKQKEKAKELLGITDDRASEIFEEKKNNKEEEK